MTGPGSWSCLSKQTTQLFGYAADKNSRRYYAEQRSDVVTNQTLDMPLTTPEAESTSNIQSETQQLLYSVGVMAYNEEANILRTLQAIIEQESQQTCMEEIIVVASGCTDHTVPIVQEFMRDEPRVRLIVQERREGKASAINLLYHLNNGGREKAIIGWNRQGVLICREGETSMRRFLLVG